MLDADRAGKILNYLNRFRYATFEHELVRLLWWTGKRLGPVRAIDIADYKPAKSRLELYHRPESDT